MINSPWDYYYRKPKWWTNPLRVAFILICVLMLMLVGYCSYAQAEDTGNPMHDTLTIKPLKSFHPPRGTVGGRMSLDRGTIVVRNGTDYSIRVSMGPMQGDFIWSVILPVGQKIYFYGVTEGDYVVAWAALSHEHMNHGAKIVQIKEETLNHYFVDRMVKSTGKCDQELQNVLMYYYRIMVEENAEGNA